MGALVDMVFSADFRLFSGFIASKTALLVDMSNSTSCSTPIGTGHEPADQRRTLLVEQCSALAIGAIHLSPHRASPAARKLSEVIQILPRKER